MLTRILIQPERIKGESQNAINGPFGTRIHGVITGWAISDIIWE